MFYVQRRHDETLRLDIPVQPDFPSTDSSAALLQNELLDTIQTVILLLCRNL